MHVQVRYNAVILKTGAKRHESSCASTRWKGVVQMAPRTGRGVSRRLLPNFPNHNIHLCTSRLCPTHNLTRLLIHACFRCNSSGDPARSAPDAASLPSLGSRKHTIRDDHWHREISKLLRHTYRANFHWLRRASKSNHGLD